MNIRKYTEKIAGKLSFNGLVKQRNIVPMYMHFCIVKDASDGKCLHALASRQILEKTGLVASATRDERLRQGTVFVSMLSMRVADLRNLPAGSSVA